MPGRTYCFSVRARDRAENLSGWSSESCVTTPLDDRALKMTSGRWTRLTDRYSLDGTVSRTSTHGATLSLGESRGRQVGLVMTTCTGCGRVGVYVGGRLVTTVATYSRGTARRKLVGVWSTGGREGAVTVRLRQKGRTMIVDGLAVLR